jgi:hypothetical protein
MMDYRDETSAASVVVVEEESVEVEEPEPAIVWAIVDDDQEEPNPIVNMGDEPTVEVVADEPTMEMVADEPTVEVVADEPIVNMGEKVQEESTEPIVNMGDEDQEIVLEEEEVVEPMDQEATVMDIADIYPDQEVVEIENPITTTITPSPPINPIFLHSTSEDSSFPPVNLRKFDLIVQNEIETESVEVSVPSIIFIVPYRNREVYQESFDRQMKQVILSDKPEGYYKIYYIHQTDSRPFNRGAMKNIGFFMVKYKYPLHYKNITLVFNDVDTTPRLPETIPSYETRHGIVKHFYGMAHTLGGIVSINAGDFESINGFPNYWTWGYEDNMFNKRVTSRGMHVDRSTFYQINDSVHIQQMTTSNQRMVNQGEFDRYSRNIDEGLNTIRELRYVINEETGFVDVTHFDTTYAYEPDRKSVV